MVGRWKRTLKTLDSSSHAVAICATASSQDTLTRTVLLRLGSWVIGRAPGLLLGLEEQA